MGGKGSSGVWDKQVHTSVFKIDIKQVIESIPRQIDKKSGVPEEERGVWGSQRGNRGLEFSRRRKGHFFLHFLVRII